MELKLFLEVSRSITRDSKHRGKRLYFEINFLISIKDNTTDQMKIRKELDALIFEENNPFSFQGFDPKPKKIV